MQNEHYLRITDSVNIECPLDDETEYQITGVITTDGCNTKPLYDGGKKYTYKSKFTSHVVLIKGDKMIRTRDKKKWSQKMRAAIEMIGHERGEDEYFYDKSMAKIISQLEEII